MDSPRQNAKGIRKLLRSASPENYSPCVLRLVGVSLIPDVLVKARLEGMKKERRRNSSGWSLRGA